MLPEVQTWLYDILRAIEEVEEFLGMLPPTFAAYQQSTLTRRATERNLEIIGEAMRILRPEPDIQLSNARQVVATRNRIIHGYDSISDELGWSIAVRHLPLLKTEVQQLLGR